MDDQSSDGQSDVDAAILAMVRPSWADPSYTLATNHVAWKDTVLTSAPAVLLAARNPRRWAIGFVNFTPSAGSLKVSPWADLTNVPFVTLTPGGSVWYWLFQYGPLINEEWWVLSTAVNTIRTIEVSIN